MTNEEQEKAMLTHQQVWAAIEALANRHGLTASGLARRSGLDPTTFNRSKRIAADGRQRWPSTESVAKILEATNVTLDEFLTLLRQTGNDEPGGPEGFAEDGQASYGPESLQQIEIDWKALEFLGGSRNSLIMLEVAGESMLPVYKAGCRLVVRKSGKVTAGDRVAVATRRGTLLVRDVARKSSRTLFLRGWNVIQPDCVLQESEIDWTAKVLWASQ